MWAKSNNTMEYNIWVSLQPSMASLNNSNEKIKNDVWTISYNKDEGEEV